MHQYVLMDAICFPGDLCFRSGDILVSDEYGYLYFKVSKVWRQVSCEIGTGTFILFFEFLRIRRIRSIWPDHKIIIS